MELVQTPLGPLNVFATVDTLETDAIVQVEYNLKLLLPLWQKSRIFCKIVVLQRLHKQTNGQIHTRVIMKINTLIADIVVCLFVYFANFANQSVLKRKKDHDRSKLHCYFRKL